jgi:hypothetical protein
MRYISAEQSIAAAGAAFAWSDDEFRDVQPFALENSWSKWMRRIAAKAMLACAFIVA